MKEKPANNQETIHSMQAGLASLEGALRRHCTHLGAAVVPDKEQKLAALLREGIEDLKVALFYAQNDLICPECMTPNSLESAFCCNCGLEFDI